MEELQYQSDSGSSVDEESIEEKYKCENNFQKSDDSNQKNFENNEIRPIHDKVISTPLLDLLPKSLNGKGNKVAIERITSFIESGRDLAETLRASKQFSNPYILTKIVQILEIDEIGSNYPENTFNPHEYNEDDFEEAISNRYNHPLSPLPVVKHQRNLENDSSTLRKRKKSGWDETTTG